MDQSNDLVSCWQDSAFRAFALLVALFCVTFLTGGSSRPYEPGLEVLRSTALVCAALGLWGLQIAHIKKFAAIWVLFFAIVLLTMAHLVPLPFSWWSTLPGRDILVEVDRVVGLGQISRPLSMSPDATWNALWSLSVPLAVLVLAVQLDCARQRWALALVLLFAIISGLFGLLQASGVNIEFYLNQTPSAGLFQNRNHEGALLALVFPMAAAAAVSGLALPLSRDLERLGLAGIALIAVPLVMVTGSRSGLLLAGAALGSIPLLRIDRKPASGVRARKMWKAYAVVGALVAGLVGVTLLFSRGVAIDRFDGAGADLRWSVWQSIFPTISYYLPWGSGIGSYVESYQVFEPDVLLRPKYSNNAHNDWLEVAMVAGIPGLLLLGACVFLVIWACIRSVRSKASAATFARLGAAMIILLALGSLTDYPIRTPIMSAVIALAAVWASASGGFVETELRRT